MCSTFTPDCGFDNSTTILIEDVYCPNAKCLGELCLPEKTFQSLGKAIINVRNERLCARCAIFPFEDQSNSFFLSLGQGVYIFEKNPKSVQDVIGDVYCPGKYCSKREKCESFAGYVTTLRSIYACGKCGAWLFVDNFPYMLQEHVRTTKTEKTRFFCQKKMNLVPNKQLLLNVPFQSTKYRKKELCVDNKVRETIGDLFCPACINEKCVYISTNKTTSFYDCKKCKA